MQKIERGDIFYADLSPVIGSEQGGTRPVVIIQNDVGNRYSPTTIIAPVTSQMTRLGLPTHVKAISRISDLPKNSVILLEQIRTIDKKRLQKKLGSFDQKFMDRIDRAIKISLGISEGWSK